MYEVNPTSKQILSDVRRLVTGRYGNGGYPAYAVCSDGSMLCAECVRQNYREISRSTRTKAYRDSGWRIVGIAPLWETETHPELCGHCSSELDSAYGIVNPPEPEEAEGKTSKRKALRRQRRQAEEAHRAEA